MKSYFINLFKYHAWANQKVIEGIISSRITEGKILKLLSHLFLAEKTWLQRLKLEKYDNRFWIELTLEECNTLAENNEKQINAYLHSLFETKVKYTNSKGIEYANTITEVLTHLSHHSSYHRGQIAGEMRKLGEEPVYTDYVAYLR